MSPFADYLKYSYSNSIVDDVSGKSYDYSLLKADGTPFPIERFTLSREDAICVIKTVDTEDGLFFASGETEEKKLALCINDFPYYFASGMKDNNSISNQL